MLHQNFWLPTIDFLLILAEVERHVELELSKFLSGNIHFSDTLSLFWMVFAFVYINLSFIQMKKMGKRSSRAHPLGWRGSTEESLVET